MVRKLCLFCLLVSGLRVPLRGQEKTVHWQEVQVSARHRQGKTPPDTLAARFGRGGSGWEGLPGLVLRNYGLAGSSGLGLRGAGTAHTVFLWRGIPIENRSLGQTDASLIPASMAESARVMAGSSSSLAAGQAFGGTVELQPDDSLFSGTRFQVRAGSFGTLDLRTRAGFRAGKVRSHIRVWDEQAHNSFRYFWEGNEHWTTHAFRRFRGLEGSVLIPLSPHLKLNSSVWIQHSFRQLPPSRHEAQSRATQTDLNRHFLQELCYNRGRVTAAVRAGLSTGLLDYTDPLKQIFSLTRSATGFLGGEYTREKGRHRTGTEFLASAGRVHSANYRRNLTENQLVTAFRWSVSGKRWEITLRPRTVINQIEKANRFLFTPMAEGRLRSKTGRWRLCIQKKARVPSLNDLYWPAGGNPALRPEKGFSAEMEWEYSLTSTRGIRLDFRLTPFASRISGYIQWLPAGNIWTPVNIPSADIRGTEFQASAGGRFGRIRWRLLQELSFTSSRAAKARFEGDEGAGRQLAYVPVWQHLTWLSVQAGPASLQVWVPVTGNRLLPDGRTALPAYTLVHARVSWSCQLRRYGSLEAFAEGRNLGHLFYEPVAGFVMPGRHGNLGIQFHFQ